MSQATIRVDDGTRSLSYLVDSGVDLSIIHKLVFRKAIGNMVPHEIKLSGLGNETIASLVKCVLLVTLQETIIEIDFPVVSDFTIPRVDAGMLLVGENWILFVENMACIDLRTSIQVIICLFNKIEVLGLDEQQNLEWNIILEARKAAPSVVTTEKLKIKFA